MRTISLIALLLAGCSLIAPFDYDDGSVVTDGDADGDADGDIDGDADADVDANADADADDDSVVPESVEVEPVYDEAPSWNEYVVNNGANPYSADGTKCVRLSPGRANACLHSGELRKVTLERQDSCVGLTLEEELEAFSWTCRDNGREGPVTFYTKALAPGKGLRDLITADGFRENAVTITHDGHTIAQSVLADWGWINTFQRLFSATGLVDLSGLPGTIYFVENLIESWGINLNGDGLALVTLGNAAVTYLGIAPNCNSDTGTPTGPLEEECMVMAGDRAFLWIEGRFVGENTSEYGIALAGVSFSHIHGTTVERIHNDRDFGAGIRLFEARSNTLESVTVLDSNSGIFGVQADTNLFSNVACANNAIYGLHLNQSDGNTLWLVRADNNRRSGVVLEGSVENVIVGLTAANNGAEPDIYGMGLNLRYDSNDNALVGLTAFGNRTYGLALRASSRNTVLHTTLTNSGVSGLRVVDASNNAAQTIHSLLSVNSGENGIVLSTNDSVLSDVAVANNGTHGVYIRTGSSENAFRGELIVSDNVADMCRVEVEANNAGLNNVHCNESGSDGDVYSDQISDAMLLVDVDLTNAFRAEVVVDDSINFSDDDGSRFFDDINDWFRFEHHLRGWGLTGGGFPDADQRGPCTSNFSCSIWDWRLTSESLLRDRHGVWGSVGDDCPPGAHEVMRDMAEILHYEGINAVENDDAVGGNDDGICEAGEVCNNVFLSNAMEVMLDRRGDDDGLCEQGEACIFAPNFGANQGVESAGVGACHINEDIMVGVDMTALRD